MSLRGRGRGRVATAAQSPAHKRKESEVSDDWWTAPLPARAVAVPVSRSDTALPFILPEDYVDENDRDDGTWGNLPDDTPTTTQAMHAQRERDLVASMEPEQMFGSLLGAGRAQGGGVYGRNNVLVMDDGADDADNDVVDVVANDDDDNDAPSERAVPWHRASSLFSKLSEAQASKLLNMLLLRPTALLDGTDEPDDKRAVDDFVSACIMAHMRFLNRRAMQAPLSECVSEWAKCMRNAPRVDSHERLIVREAPPDARALWTEQPCTEFTVLVARVTRTLYGYVLLQRPPPPSAMAPLVDDLVAQQQQHYCARGGFLLGAPDTE